MSQWSSHAAGIAHRRAELARRHFPGTAEVTSIFESGHGTYAGRLPGELTLRRAERALADRAEEASEWAQSAARRLLVGACGIDRFAEAFAPFAERGEGALLEHAAAAYRARAQLLSNPRDPTPLVLRVGNGLQSDPAWMYRRIIAFAGLLATDAAVGRRERPWTRMEIRCAWPSRLVAQARLVTALAALCEAAPGKLDALHLQVISASELAGTSARACSTQIASYGGGGTTSAAGVGDSGGSGRRVWRVFERALAVALRSGGLQAGARLVQHHMRDAEGGGAAAMGDMSLAEVRESALFDPATLAADLDRARADGRRAVTVAALRAFAQLPSHIAMRALAAAVPMEAALGLNLDLGALHPSVAAAGGSRPWSQLPPHETEVSAGRGCITVNAQLTRGAVRAALIERGLEVPPRPTAP